MTAMMRLGLVLLLCGLATSLSDQLTDRDRKLTEALVESRKAVAVKQGVLNIYRQILNLAKLPAPKDRKVAKVLAEMQVKAEAVVLKVMGSVPFALKLKGAIARNGNNFVFTGRSNRNFVGFTFRINGLTTIRRDVKMEDSPILVTLNSIRDIVDIDGTLVNSLGDTYVLDGNSVTVTHEGVDFSATGVSEDSGLQFTFDGSIVVNAAETEFTLTGDGAMSRLAETNDGVVDIVSSMLSNFMP